MTSDLDLYRAWRLGDERAGNELFSRHFDAVFRFFTNKVSDGAEDLVQQTFLACIKANPGYQGTSSFRTYLFTAARSRLYDHLQHRRRKRDPIDFGVTSLADLGTTPSGKLARDQQLQLLHAALRQLPIDHQIALELAHIEGLRGPEIAAVLDIPQATVRSRLHRGLAALKREIERLTHDVELRERALASLAVVEPTDDEAT